MAFTDEQKEKILTYEAKLELVVQLEAWLSERASLVTLQTTEKDHWGKSEDYINGIKDGLLELDKFLWYLKAPLIKQAKTIYNPLPKNNVIPFVPRDALYANEEDREEDDDE